MSLRFFSKPFLCKKTTDILEKMAPMCHGEAMPKKKTANHPLFDRLCEKYDLVISFLGAVLVYCGTDLAYVSRVNIGGVMRPVVAVTNEWFLRIGLILIVIGFIESFSKKLGIKVSLFVAVITSSAVALLRAIS